MIFLEVSYCNYNVDIDEAAEREEITDWDNLDVDSDDDVELLTHGVEPELPPEVVAEICESKHLVTLICLYFHITLT